MYPAVTRGIGRLALLTQLRDLFGESRLFSLPRRRVEVGQHPYPHCSGHCGAAKAAAVNVAEFLNEPQRPGAHSRIDVGLGGC